MEFLTYKKFHEKEDAETLIQILKDHAIEFELAEDRESLDSLYGDKLFNEQFYIKLKGSDFTKADLIIAKLSDSQLSTVEEDHYLFSFSDEELFDILSKPDEWSDLDYQLSKKILLQRGKEINDEVIELLKKKRINELAKPEESQRNWIYAGYIFALLGGLIAMFIGWHLSSFKKTLPNGQRVYGYTENDRKSGMKVLILGIIMFFLWMTVGLTQDY